jgi:hypothetical protein
MRLPEQISNSFLFLKLEVIDLIELGKSKGLDDSYNE